MKLNDPFGRMESRHQLGYESMRDVMQKSGINTAEEASKIITQSKKRAVQYICIGVAVLLLVTVVLPKALPITLSLAIFMTVWIASSTINGQRYIQRYIDEDLKGEQP